jgi:FixJ family two-component response regulator
MNVALVDDDESVSRAVMRLLRLAGMNPASFRSMETFLAYPGRYNFDCLVLDIYIDNGQSGLDLKARLNQEGNRIPVIFFSAHDDVETQTEIARVGCHKFVRKGDNIQLLIEALQEIKPIPR